MRRLAQSLLAISVPDPELQCELIGWAMVLICLADVMTWWSAVWVRGQSIRLLP